MTITPLFEKMLSASDAGRIGRLVLPKACAEVQFCHMMISRLLVGVYHTGVYLRWITRSVIERSIVQNRLSCIQLVCRFSSVLARTSRYGVDDEVGAVGKLPVTAVG